VNAPSPWLPGPLHFTPLVVAVIAWGVVCVFAPRLVCAACSAVSISFPFSDNDDPPVGTPDDPAPSDLFLLLLQLQGLAAILVGTALMVGWL